MLIGKQLAFNTVPHNAVEELCVFKGDRRIEVADVRAGRQFCIGITAHRIARLIAPLDVFPKQEAVAEMLILQNGICANDRRAYKAPPQGLGKGRGKEGKNCEMEPLNAGKRLTVAGAHLNLSLASAILGREGGKFNGKTDLGMVDAIILPLVGMLKLGLIFKAIALLYPAAARKCAITHRNKRRKTVKQGIDKAIFVGQ